MLLTIFFQDIITFIDIKYGTVEIFLKSGQVEGHIRNCNEKNRLIRFSPHWLGTFNLINY